MSTTVTLNHWDPETGETIRGEDVSAWNVHGEPEEGIYVSIRDDSETENIGLHITKAQLAAMGYVPAAE